MATEHLEREYKLRALAPISVAAVDLVLQGRDALAAERAHVDSYLDDERGSLLRAGIGLRVRRSGSEARIGCKRELPRAGELHTRRELEADWNPWQLPTSAAELPPSLRDQCEPFVLARRLVPLAEIGVRRHERRLVDGARVLGEVLLDEVTVAVDGQQATFTEVEVEVGDDAQTCAEVAALLARSLPLEPALDNKLAHALALVGRAPQPAAAAAPTQLGELLQARIAAHLVGMREAECGIRSEGGAAHVHALRVHLRRLRTLVRAFRSAFVPEVAESLADPLAAWNRQLAELRELDVTQTDFAEVLAQVPAALQDAAEAVRQRLQTLRAAALARVVAELRSAAHLAARERVDAAVSPAAFEPEAFLAAPAAAAQVEVARSARRLRRGLRELPKTPPLEPLHELRLTVKRLRYLAEECAAVLPAMRKRALRRLARAQVRVGEVCDHEAAAARYLRMLADGAQHAWSQDAAALLGAAATVHHAQQRTALARASRALARVDRASVWREFLRD